MQNVCGDGWTERAVVFTRVARASGPLVGLLPEIPKGSTCSPEQSIAVGLRGRRHATHLWSPESQTADLRLSILFPSGVVKMLFS